MIASLRGQLVHKEATAVILDVGGVGYRVSVPASIYGFLPELGETTHLHVHFHMRAEEISLFGFRTLDDQRVFELLLSVTGIGPKVALSVLSALDAETLARTVAAEDTRSLVRIPGLGLKTAQRLVLELRDKLAQIAFERKVDQFPKSKAAKPAAEDIFEDVVEGLISLGYNRNDSRRAAERALKEIEDKANMGMAIKVALNILTGAGGKG
jgi:Holliday junction DNA helicase RuvA